MNASTLTLLPLDFIPKKLSKNVKDIVQAKLGVKGLKKQDKQEVKNNVEKFRNLINSFNKLLFTGYLSQGTLPVAEYTRFIDQFSVCTHELQNIANLILSGFDTQTMEIQVAYATLEKSWQTIMTLNNDMFTKEGTNWYTIPRETIKIHLVDHGLEEKACPLFRFQVADVRTGNVILAAPNCFILNNGGKSNLIYAKEYSENLEELVKTALSYIPPVCGIENLESRDDSFSPGVSTPSIETQDEEEPTEQVLDYGIVTRIRTREEFEETTTLIDEDEFYLVNSMEEPPFKQQRYNEDDLLIDNFFRNTPEFNSACDSTGVVEPDALFFDPVCWE